MHSGLRLKSLKFVIKVFKFENNLFHMKKREERSERKKKKKRERRERQREREREREKKESAS